MIWWYKTIFYERLFTPMDIYINNGYNNKEAYPKANSDN